MEILREIIRDKEYTRISSFVNMQTYQLTDYSLVFTISIRIREESLSEWPQTASCCPVMISSRFV